MTSKTSKALVLISGLVLSATSLTGCAPASSQTNLQAESVVCEDLTNPSADDTSYTLQEWNKDSSTYSGFGLFRCDQDVNVTLEVSPLGSNLLAGNTSVSIGEDQMEFASLKKVGPLDLQADSVLATNGHAVRVSANQKFQPFVELTQSQVQLTYGDEPVEMLITVSANDKAPVTFKKVLKLATSS